MASRLHPRLEESREDRHSRSRPPAKKSPREIRRGPKPSPKKTGSKAASFVSFVRAVVRYPGRRMVRHRAFPGAAVRQVGRGARDLDLPLRRDGLGLVYAILTVVTAVVAWWGFRRYRTRGHVRGRGAVGSLDLLVPLFFGWMTWRTLRHPGSAGSPPTRSSAACS